MEKSPVRSDAYFPEWKAALTIDLFHDGVKHGMQNDTRNLIGLKTTFITAEPIKFCVSFASHMFDVIMKKVHYGVGRQSS